MVIRQEIERSKAADAGEAGAAARSPAGLLSALLIADEDRLAARLQGKSFGTRVRMETGCEKVE